MIDHITYSEKLIVGALDRAEKLESAALEATDVFPTAPRRFALAERVNECAHRTVCLSV